MTDEEMDELIDNATADASFIADVDKLRAECARLRDIEATAVRVDRAVTEALAHGDYLPAIVNNELGQLHAKLSAN